MSTEPLISIVTICLNAADYIEETIRSVLAQTYPNIEYTIIDGGSTDGTIEKARSRLGPSGRIISGSDDGIYDAMNRGASLASGEYVLFLHADDAFIDNDAVLSLVQSMRQSGRTWVCAFYKMRNSRNEVIKEDRIQDFTFRDMLRADQIRHQTTLEPLSYVREFPFRKKYKFAMDYDHFLHVWKKYGPPHILHRHISYFRWDGRNLSSHFELSLRDEYRVRADFRRENGQYVRMLQDLVVYALRKMKIMLYYNRKFGPDRRS